MSSVLSANPSMVPPAASSSSKVNHGEKMMPWVEKYRPKTVKDIAHQDEVVKTLTQSIETGNIPHLLFYGTPGTGKTSSALALAKELYGQEFYKARVLELNASDERGIKVVREKIKNFACTSVGNNSLNGKKLAPFKLIILDEADSMTNDAQSALRRTMELYTNVTRFCLICNYVSRIIDPIASRCAKFRFQPLGDKAIVKRLEYICEKEGVECDKKSYDTLLKVSQGDMRKAITYLQSAARYNQNVVDSITILDISGRVSDSLMDRFQEVMKSTIYKDLEKFTDHLIAEGYGVDSFIDQMHNYIIEDESLNDTQKAYLCMKIAETDKALEDGSGEEIQLRAILSHAFQIYKTKNPNLDEV